MPDVRAPKMNMNTSSGSWRIVPKESWREIVAEYADRISLIRQMDPWDVSVSNLSSKEFSEKCVFSIGDDPLAEVIIKRLGIYGSSTYFIGLQVALNVLNLWESGQFVVVPLNTRFVYECWGGVHYANSILHRFVVSGDAEKEFERVERLTFGTRSEIHLPWGGTSADLKSIHVMDFIHCLKDAEPDAEDVYAFLSEASHPSFTENSYFQMAGPPISNWDNKAFERTMRPQLERCFRILEKSVEGLQTDSFKLILASRILENAKWGATETEP